MVAFTVKVLFNNWVARIVGVELRFSNQEDVKVKGIQNIVDLINILTELR